MALAMLTVLGEAARQLLCFQPPALSSITLPDSLTLLLDLLLAFVNGLVP